MLVHHVTVGWLSTIVGLQRNLVLKKDRLAPIADSEPETSIKHSLIVAQNQLLIILFLYLCVPTLKCGMWDLWFPRGLPSCGEGAPEVHGLSSSVWRLSFSLACGILVTQPGTEPASAALQGRFLTTGPPGKSLFLNQLMVGAIEMSLDQSGMSLESGSVSLASVLVLN